MKTTMFLLRPLLLLLSALIVFIPAVQASGQAGQVIMATGQVSALAADGSERLLQRRSAIAVTDTIVTGPGSRVQIRFIDNALLALQENSRLNIREYHLAQEGSGQSKVLMELVEGGFRTLTGSIGKGNEQAYQVTTPVASIGIRGTLYSALLQGNQLTAGVWQGGIALTTAGGQQVNLGNDSSFSFGRIGPNGFQGLLQPPAELDPAPAGQSDGNTNGNNDNTGAPDDGRIDGDNVPETTDNVPPPPRNGEGLPPISEIGATGIPNPFDQLNREQIEDTLNPIPSLDPRFQSEAEYERYLGSSKTVLLARSDTGEVLMGKAFTGDDGKTVLVTGEPSQLVLYRYDGSATYPINSNGISLTGYSDSEWGIWGEGSQPAVQQYTAEDSTTSIGVEGPLYWMSATPLQLIDPLSGEYSFTYALENYLLGTDSFGNSLSSSMSNFTLDMGTGQANGSFSAYYSSVSETTSSWNFSFSGQMTTGTNNAAMLSFSIEAADSFVTAFDGANEFSGTLNADSSLFSGFLIGAENTPEGALTMHNLKADIETNDGPQQIWANGVMLWEAQPIGEVVTGP